MNQKHLSRRTFLGATGATLLGSLIAMEGCSSGGGGTTINPPVDTNLSGVLRSSQQTASPVSSASGTVNVLIKSDASSIHVSANLTGLTGVTMAHIHVGRAGTNGPVIFPLFDAGGTPQNLTNINLTLVASDLTAQPAAGVVTFDDALQFLSAGQCYINVHTTTNPSGEIRGQIGAVNLYSAMTGLNLVPAPLDTTAQASATFVLSAKQDSIGLTFDSVNLTNASSITVRVGDPTTNGPAIFSIASAGQVLTSSDLQAQPSAGINSFADAINAMLSGRTYVEVRTTANPSGELRGQILAQAYVGNLLGTEEVISVTTTASALVLLTMSRDKASMTLQVQSAKLTNANVTSIRLYSGARKTNGPAVYNIYDSGTDGAYGGALVRTLLASNLITGGSITNFSDFVTALNAGKIYAEIQTTAHPAGELRGQLKLQR